MLTLIKCTYWLVANMARLMLWFVCAMLYWFACIPCVLVKLTTSYEVTKPKKKRGVKN